MSTDLTPQTPPFYLSRYLQETPDGWQGADHPDGPWRPISALQTQPPFPVAGEPVSDWPILQWTENIPPNEQCRYDHCIAGTPFGRFLITWKSWKDYQGPTVDETPWGDWYKEFNSVDEAKAACQQGMNERLAQWGRPTVPPALEPSPTVRFPVYNNTGAEIPKGTPVYVTGSSGTRITIAPADASVDVENVTAPEPPPTVRYEFEITDEHDQTVASGDATTLEEAEREGRHYLAQYSQDGPCTLELRRVEVLEVSSPAPAPAAADPPLWRAMMHAYDNAPAPPRDAPDDWTDRVGYAAEILAVRDRVVPEEAPPVAPTDSPAWLHWQQRQAIRALLTAEAARAEAGE